MFRRWRRRQPGRVLYVPVMDAGTTITASGLHPSRKPRLRMVEIQR